MIFQPYTSIVSIHWFTIYEPHTLESNNFINSIFERGGVAIVLWSKNPVRSRANYVDQVVDRFQKVDE